MNSSHPFRHLAAAAFACLLAASCSDLTVGVTTLPPGKYAIAFTAQVDGLAVSRATTGNTWEGTEEIAVQIGGEVKKYTAAAGGSLSVAGGGTPFYWQTTSGITVNAWYPYNAIKPAAADLRVKADQSDNANYQSSDWLEAVDASVSFRNPALTFKHRTAKVVVTLKPGEGVADVSDATVTFVNQAGVEGDGTEVIPKKETPGNGGGATYTALVIPQQMQGKKFIKVSSRTNSGEYDYFYTPAGTNDANLESGKQYTYTITVKKTGLQVESVTASWNDSATDGIAENATFKIHLPAFSAPENTSDYKVTDAQGTNLTASGGIYSTSSDRINISLSANDTYILKKFLLKVTAGICKQKSVYKVDTRTYTYTFYDIRSDLWLSDIQAEAGVFSMPSLSNPNVGDYYYADGTWSATYPSATVIPCIGIIFKVGARGGDNVGNYSLYLADNTIHGYVVALQDALSTAGNWGTRGTDTPIGNVDNKAVTAYTGHSDTETIISTYSSGGTWNDYQAFKAIVDYRSSVPAPDISSNWYLPSLAQLGDVYSALGSIRTPLATAGTAFKTENDGRYWTSSEISNNGLDAWYIQMNNGTKAAYAKNGASYSRACYARAILTF